MKIQVQYYAALREKTGTSLEEIHSAARTPRDLYRELQSRYGFAYEPEQLRAAVNDSFRDMDCELQENDLIVFIPPVAGG
ncbi:MAG: MoaD/ThiS family protein [Acidobacteria bacterium]|nr:MoaD/ThiS family protein [Acidobacteriota bacterium]